MSDLRRRVTAGWPVALEMEATMPAPPEVVWELITDWERQGDWMLEASDFVVTSARREGIGVEAEATIKIAGIETRDRVRVTGWEPPRRLAIEHLGWVSGAGEIVVVPSGPARSHFFWREELYPPLGALGAMGLTVFKPIMQRIFDRDVRVLQGLAATRSV
jgi:carbon monoxide dehydrogenase subunit G